MLGLNDLKFNKFAYLSILLILAFNISVILDNIGVNIIFFRQITGFLFLTFFPGYTVLRILRIHKIGEIKAFLYSVGLSLTLIMFTGFFINFIFPFFGVIEPLRLVHTLLTFDFIYLFLLILAYIRDKNWNGYTETEINLRNIITPQFLALSILPFLSIFGAYFSSYYNIGNNFIFFLIFVFSLFPIVIFLMNKKSYLFLLWIYAISIIFIFSFNPSFEFLWGNDIIHEMYLSKLVLNNGIWDTNLSSTTNSMLSIVILNPIYSIFLDMSSTMIFKIVYSFIFSLVPIILFKSYNKFFNKYESFMAVFFFMASSIFFTEMLQLARQQIAELYLALFILLLMDNNLNKNIKRFLFLLFGFSLIVSHYGTTWLFIASLIVGFFLIKIMKAKESNNFLFNINYIISFTVISLTWYLYNAATSSIIAVVNIGTYIFGSISELFHETQGTLMLTRSVSGIHIIGRYLTFINLALISIGVLFILLIYKKTKINKEFLVLIFIWFSYNIAGMVVPYFGSALNVTRLLHLSLLFLSPCFIIGAKTIFLFGAKFIKINFFNKKKILYKLISIYLVIIFLFSSGLIYSATNSPPYSWYIDERDNRGPRWVESEFYSANWLNSYFNSDFKIYTDVDNSPIFRMFYLNKNDYVVIFKTPNDRFLAPYYLYLSGARNIIDEEFQILPSGFGSIMTIPLDSLTYYRENYNKMNKIYSNPMTVIYWRGYS